MEKKFSIVVIACDVGKYLRVCLDSILNQTYSDFDIYIGTEDSSDDTLDIVAEYVEKSDRIITQNFKKSGSASVIRNWGIDTVDGEYVLFVDGDDFIEKNSLKVFAEKISRYGTLDLIPAAAIMKREASDNSYKIVEQIFCGSYEDSLFCGTEYFERVCPLSKLRTATWMSCYRTDFLRKKSLYQPIGRRHQDDEWTPRVFFNAQRISPVKFAWYNYLKRNGSITMTADPKSIYDIADNIVSFINFSHNNILSANFSKQYSNWIIDYLSKLFGYRVGKKYSRRIRLSGFKRALSDTEKYRDICRMSKEASISKRLLVPIFSIARVRGLFIVADLLYDFLYEPIVFYVNPKLSAFLSRIKKK